jgi:hypothetical protein
VRVVWEWGQVRVVRGWDQKFLKMTTDDLKGQVGVWHFIVVKLERGVDGFPITS